MTAGAGPLLYFNTTKLILRIVQVDFVVDLFSLALAAHHIKIPPVIFWESIVTRGFDQGFQTSQTECWRGQHQGR